MNTKYVLITETRKPMFFNILACAELYKVITGGEVFAITDSVAVKV